MVWLRMTTERAERQFTGRNGPSSVQMIPEWYKEFGERAEFVFLWYSPGKRTTAATGKRASLPPSPGASKGPPLKQTMSTNDANEFQL